MAEVICDICGMVRRSYCYIHRAFEMLDAEARAVANADDIICLICCNCPQERKIKDEFAEDDQPDDKGTGQAAPRMPISTPEEPGGCSCRLCFTWAELFPSAHRAWMQFRAAQMLKTKDKSWWKWKDRSGHEVWHDEWVAFLDKNWREDIPK